MRTDLRSLDNMVSSTEGHAEINLSPLIDMVFLLLIFFMVTSVFARDAGVDVDRPEAKSAEDLEATSIVITVTRDGRVIHGGREIGLSRVRGVVARILRDRTAPVILVADKKTDTGLVVDIIDECKQAGAEEVGLSTERE